MYMYQWFAMMYMHQWFAMNKNPNLAIATIENILKTKNAIRTNYTLKNNPICRHVGQIIIKKTSVK